LLPDGQALVQTIDFFTPIVDDPYAYGQIAAANALSDVYAMGGRPISALNVACFDPTAAPAEVWAEVLRGMAEKTIEAGAAILGGHTVEDREPKFGMAVTGLVDPARAFANTNAQDGDVIYLTKPLGTGIVTTAAKGDAASSDELRTAVAAMATLNRAACEAGQAAGVRCATDITGFGLAGHLFNVARASGVEIELWPEALPLLPGVPRMVAEGHVTGGAGRNRAFLGERLRVEGADETILAVILDPQTSGGLALFSRIPIPGATPIGRVRLGEPTMLIRANVETG
jgi:selenide,water dikinase